MQFFPPAPHQAGPTTRNSFFLGFRVFLNSILRWCKNFPFGRISEAATMRSGWGNEADDWFYSFKIVVYHCWPFVVHTFVATYPSCVIQKGPNERLQNFIRWPPVYSVRSYRVTKDIIALKVISQHSSNTFAKFYNKDAKETQRERQAQHRTTQRVSYNMFFTITCKGMNSQTKKTWSNTHYGTS